MCWEILVSRVADSRDMHDIAWLVGVTHPIAARLLWHGIVRAIGMVTGRGTGFDRLVEHAADAWTPPRPYGSAEPPSDDGHARDRAARYRPPWRCRVVHVTRAGAPPYLARALDAGGALSRRPTGLMVEFYAEPFGPCPFTLPSPSSAMDGRPAHGFASEHRVVLDFGTAIHGGGPTRVGASRCPRVITHAGHRRQASDAGRPVPRLEWVAPLMEAHVGVAGRHQNAVFLPEAVVEFFETWLLPVMADAPCPDEETRELRRGHQRLRLRRPPGTDLWRTAGMIRHVEEAACRHSERIGSVVTRRLRCVHNALVRRTALAGSMDAICYLRAMPIHGLAVEWIRAWELTAPFADPRESGCPCDGEAQAEGAHTVATKADAPGCVPQVLLRLLQSDVERLLTKRKVLAMAAQARSGGMGADSSASSGLHPGCAHLEELCDALTRGVLSHDDVLSHLVGHPPCRVPPDAGLLLTLPSAP